VDAWGVVPAPTFEVMRAIKREFDPTGVLNAGRFVGGL
jgi:FAD/FMN-containing dehydrogenase